MTTKKKTIMKESINKMTTSILAVFILITINTLLLLTTATSFLAKTYVQSSRPLQIITIETIIISIKGTTAVMMTLWTRGSKQALQETPHYVLQNKAMILRACYRNRQPQKGEAGLTTGVPKISATGNYLKLIRTGMISWM